MYLFHMIGWSDLNFGRIYQGRRKIPLTLVAYLEEWYAERKTIKLKLAEISINRPQNDTETVLK